MYHLIVEKGFLRVLDSTRERFNVKCLNISLAPGHYRIPLIERFAPRTRRYGSGRFFIDALGKRDVADLVTSEKAELRYETALRFERQPVLPIGIPPSECSIHGGGETLTASTSVANFQPLTDSSVGIRIQNGDLVAIAEFLERRLRIQQLVVLTVMP